MDKKSDGSVVSVSSLLMNMVRLICGSIFTELIKTVSVHQGCQWAETENPEVGAAVQRERKCSEVKHSPSFWFMCEAA